jgi:hypothetical protein
MRITQLYVASSFYHIAVSRGAKSARSRNFALAYSTFVQLCR